MHIDPLEERLKVIREKLIKFEEAPALLKKGYRPYIPEKVLKMHFHQDEHSSEVVEVEDSGHVDGEGAFRTRLSFPSPDIEMTGNGNGDSLSHRPPLCTPLDGKKKRQKPKQQNKKASVSESTVELTTDVKNGKSPSRKKVNPSSATPKHLPNSTQLLSTLDSGSNESSKEGSQPVVLNAKLANCLSILNRWNTPGAQGSDDASVDSSVSSTSTTVSASRTQNGSRPPPLNGSSAEASSKPTAGDDHILPPPPGPEVPKTRMIPPAGSSTKAKPPQLLSLLVSPDGQVSSSSSVTSIADSVKQCLRSRKGPVDQKQEKLLRTTASSINRSKTFTMETKPKQLGKPLRAAAVVPVVEYETVEFTPGMTSKVRKYNT